MAFLTDGSAASASARVRRSAAKSSFVSGYYQALHRQSTADAFTTSSSVPLSLSVDTDHDLPDGCFLVERLVAVRRYKVCHVIIITTSTCKYCSINNCF